MRGMMNLYASTKCQEFNEESAELLYVYIKTHKVFKNVGFCLHPAYKTKELFKRNFLKLAITTKKNFVDLFSKENINFKIICGKNGAGKSTLLDLLQKDHSDSCIYVFIDKNGTFAASEKIQIFFNKTIIPSFELTNKAIRPKYCCSTHENINLYDFNINKNIVDFYFSLKPVFDGVLRNNEPIITHFEVRIFQRDFDEIVSIASNFLSKEEIEYFELNCKEDWLLFYCISCLCDSSCSELVKSKKDNLLFPLKELLIKAEKSKKFALLFNLIKELKTDFNLRQYNEFQKKLRQLSDEFEKFVKIIFRDICIPFKMDHFLNCLGYAQIKGKKRYISELSTGEYLSIKFRYELFHSLAQSERMYLTYDEPECSLHPEWCRQFLKNYLSSYKKVVDFCSKRLTHYNKKKRMTIFISTHSPFILSDITNDYIIYLKKGTDGYSKEVKIRKNTFAGNIGEMFTTNFFMDATIGDLARERIKKLVKKRELDCYDKKIIASIGDKLLKKLLERRFEINEEN